MSQWIITKDFVVLGDEDIESAIGITGRNFKKIEDCVYKFRILDDDGMICYHGLSSDNSSFDPLDDFGAPNAGATRIQYFENGSWVNL